MLWDELVRGARRVTKPLCMSRSFSEHGWYVGLCWTVAVTYGMDPSIVRGCTDNHTTTPSFNRTGKRVILYLVDLVKEIIWWTRIKGMGTDTLISGSALINMKKKLRAETEILTSSEFTERWMKVEKIAGVICTSLSVDLWVGEKRSIYSTKGSALL